MISRPSEEDVRLRLEQMGYTNEETESTLDGLRAAEPAVLAAFADWFDSGELPELEVHGYSARFFVEQRGKSPVAAILNLDWLLKDPETAARRLARAPDVVSIRRPPDE